MLKSILLCSVILSSAVYAQVSVGTGAQSKRPAYGPLVNAFLTGLAEELSELDYQLAHREITRAEYDRTKRRLLIHRRYVVRNTGQSGEDVVPEYQVLADDELGALGLSVKPEANTLKLGDFLGGFWKIIAIEPGRERFFIFERITPGSDGGGDNANSQQGADRFASRKYDPLEAIETIIVREDPPPRPNPRSNIVLTNQNPSRLPALSGTAVPVARIETEPVSIPPKILHIYLPRYSEKAREKKIEGELIIRAVFQRDGRVRNAKVEKGLGFGLDQLALESAMKIGFLPARQEGNDVDSKVQIIFSFKSEKVTVQLGDIETSVSEQGGKQ